MVLPYYNAANPAQPYSGPNNSGVAQNTHRIQRVQLQLKAGAPAPTGTQATPPVDNGWAGLYVITVGYGQTAVTAANISTLPTARSSPGNCRRCGRASRPACRLHDFRLLHRTSRRHHRGG